MTNSDAIKELEAHERGCKADHKWRDKFVDRINAKLKAKLDAREAKLSPRAKRIRDAANEADEPAISPRLLEPIPEVPPGGVVVVDDKPRRRA